MRRQISTWITIAIGTVIVLLSALFAMLENMLGR